MSTPRNYLLGSGFYRYSPDADWFAKLWVEHNLKTARPTRVYIVSVGDSFACIRDTGVMQALSDSGARIIDLPGNCGHVHQLIGKQEPAKPHHYCGWSAGVLSLAMLAYTGELDFVYCEQDALMFGDCIGTMYEELGDAGMIFGRKMKSAPWMACAQSLFLVKHFFIPSFVHAYLTMGSERDVKLLPENKFMRIKDEWSPHLVRQFSFGFDRERPLDLTEPVFYAQKLDRDELVILRGAGLIDFDKLPEGSTLFSSQA